MPQILLPLFPRGVTYINNLLAFQCQEGTVHYFNGMMPIFQHQEDDIQTFKMIVSQFYVTGVAKQSEIQRAFGVSSIMLKRAVHIYRTEGVAGFYKEKKAGGPRVLKSDIIEKIENRLEQGDDLKNIVFELGLKLDTVQRAIKKGIIKKKNLILDSELIHSSKSYRSVVDSEASMGMGATNTLDRLASSLGGLGPVAPKFESCLDVPNGGVLFGLPALLAVGLLRHTEKYFELPKGYYGIQSVFLLLAFMALARQKFIENLRFVPPGEWGKLLEGGP